MTTQTAKGQPHRYRDDPDAPGTCAQCHRIEANGAHDQAAVAEVEAARAEAHAMHQRRYGNN